MNTRRSVVIGALIGLGSVLLALTPASAATSPIAGIVATDASAPVTGQSWSAPAYPVDCIQAAGQIACTPQTPSDVKVIQCFAKVLVAGAGTTVCTTYEGHVAAIKAAGGRPLLVEYGCQIGDVVCLSFENAGRGLALAATAAMYSVANNMRFDTSSLLWTAATGEWSFWQWAILAILFGAMVWAIGAAAVSGDRAELVGAIIRSFIAFPATAITLWLTGHLLNAMDDLTWYVMTRGGAAALFSTLQQVMWAGGQANYFFAFLIHGLLMVGMLLLMLVFAFRNIVLAALIAVGPIAWMLFPVRSVGPQWVVRYVSALVVLLLTGPLTIGFVTLIINGLANVQTIWNPQSWPLIIGLILVAFAPFAIFGLFSFVGSVAADSVGSRLGSGARHTTGRSASAVGRIPSRIGAHPAGHRPNSPHGGSHDSPSTPSGGQPPRGPSEPSGNGPRSTPTPVGAAASATPTPPRPDSAPRPAERATT